MTKQTTYKCDKTGSFITEDEAVPVTTIVPRRNTHRGSHGNELVLDKMGSSNKHVSRDVLHENGINVKGEIKELEIIVVAREVVGWRDYSPSVATDPQSIDNGAQRHFLRSLTYLG